MLRSGSASTRTTWPSRKSSRRGQRSGVVNDDDDGEVGSISKRDRARLKFKSGSDNKGYWLVRGEVNRSAASSVSPDVTGSAKVVCPHTQKAARAARCRACTHPPNQVSSLTLRFSLRPTSPSGSDEFASDCHGPDDAVAAVAAVAADVMPNTSRSGSLRLSSGSESSRRWSIRSISVAIVLLFDADGAAGIRGKANTSTGRDRERRNRSSVCPSSAILGSL